MEDSIEINQENASPQIGSQMRKGMLVYCVLLLCKNGKVYSSDIMKNMRAAKLIVVEGTLYPLLSRITREGLLAYEWQESQQGPPRKYYWLTEKGQAELGALQGVYNDLHESILTLEKGEK